MNLGIRMGKLGEELPPRWWETLRKQWEDGECGKICETLEEWRARAEAVERAFLEKERAGHFEE
jgi:hypothetical protein